jgi:hypothetical protein
VDKFENPVNHFSMGPLYFVAFATMQIGREFVKKKGRGKPLP